MEVNKNLSLLHSAFSNDLPYLYFKDEKPFKNQLKIDQQFSEVLLSIQHLVDSTIQKNPCHQLSDLKERLTLLREIQQGVTSLDSRYKRRMNSIWCRGRVLLFGHLNHVVHMINGRYLAKYRIRLITWIVKHCFPDFLSAKKSTQKALLNLHIKLQTEIETLQKNEETLQKYLGDKKIGDLPIPAKPKERSKGGLSKAIEMVKERSLKNKVETSIKRLKNLQLELKRQRPVRFQILKAFRELKGLIEQQSLSHKEFSKISSYVETMVLNPAKGHEPLNFSMAPAALMELVDIKLALLIKNNDESGIQAFKRELLQLPDARIWTEILNNPVFLQFFVEVSKFLWRSEVTIRIQQLKECDISKVYALLTESNLESVLKEMLNALHSFRHLFFGRPSDSKGIQREKIIGINQSIVFFGAYPDYQIMKESFDDCIKLFLESSSKIIVQVPATEPPLSPRLLLVVNELKTTEKLFATHLKTLIAFCDEAVSTHLMTEEQRQILLKDIKPLLVASEKMVGSLEKPFSNLIEAFSPQNLSLYYIHLINAVSNYKKKAQAEAVKIEHSEKSLEVAALQIKHFGLQTLSDFLIMPTQRGGRHKMLISDILQKTPLDDLSFDHMRKSLQLEESILQLYLIRLNSVLGST